MFDLDVAPVHTRLEVLDVAAKIADLVTARHPSRHLEGPLRGRLLEAVGEDLYLGWLEVRRALRDSVHVGALRPTHLRGFKPVQRRDGSFTP